MTAHNVGGELGARRTAETGRFYGRFVYTEHVPDGPIDTKYDLYLVNRMSDGLYLGKVRHQLGTSWWYAAPPKGAPLDGRQARREWAADELDAHSRRKQRCACGMSVGNHDRPTRAAMRAWAGSGPGDPLAAPALAWQAAYHARFRGRHYNLAVCVTHAREFAQAPVDGEVLLVLPDATIAHTVRLRSAPHRAVRVTHTISGRTCEEYGWPRADASVEQVRDKLLAQGYQVVHDWRL